MEKALGLSLLGNFVLGVVLYIVSAAWTGSSIDNHQEIEKYQQRAIAAGYAAKDDTGTFYWTKKQPTP